MATNWFNGTGAFSPEELKEFIRDYQQNGKHDWQSEIDLGDDVNPGIQRLVNQITQDMGRLQDRLALTLVEYSNGKYGNETEERLVSIGGI